MEKRGEKSFPPRVNETKVLNGDLTTSEHITSQLLLTGARISKLVEFREAMLRALMEESFKVPCFIEACWVFWSVHVRIDLGGSLSNQSRASPSREKGKSKSLTEVFGTSGCLNVEVTLLKIRRVPPGLGLENEPPRSILTWDDLVSSTNFSLPKQQIFKMKSRDFNRRFDETFYEARDRFNDLLRHDHIMDFSELINSILSICS
ncbi:hypothetical protein Tco_0478564 [Tanacetum coccineum]